MESLDWCDQVEREDLENLKNIEKKKKKCAKDLARDVVEIIKVSETVVEVSEVGVDEGEDQPGVERADQDPEVAEVVYKEFPYMQVSL